MTLNEDDKKFIKNTVDSSVQKNMTELQKNNDAFKKSLSNSVKQRTKRDQYIEELKTLRQNDQATMAQRFELFQVETKKSLKEGISSVTHTVKDAAGTMGQGASRVGSGVDKIVTGIMNLNPITAMLWKNKGIVGDIVGGSLQMGAGAIKGAWGLGKTVTGGAGSLMKNAVDASLHLAFGRKKKRKETEEENPETPVGKLLSSITGESEEDTSLLPEDEEYGAESLSKINKEMQKQIEEIHQIVVKDKEKQTKELTGGMSRIYKVMDAVNGVIQVIQAKQKLLLTGVLLGAAAIVGLAAWFKSGGFQKMIHGVGQNILKGLASEGGQTAREKADQYVQDQLNQINTDAADFDNMNKSMGLTGGQDFSKTTYMTNKNSPYTGTQLQALDLQKSLQKEGFSEDRARQLVNGAWYGTSAAKFQNVSKSKPWVLKLPFKTYIPGNGIHKIKGDDTHVDFDLCRKVGKVTKMVTFTNGVANSVKSKEFKENEQIAVIDINARIIGDWNDFCGLKEGQSYADALYEDRKENIAKEANKIMDEPYHTPGLGDAVSREADKRLGVFKEYNGDNLKESPKQFEEEDGTVTGGAAGVEPIPGEPINAFDVSSTPDTNIPQEQKTQAPQIQSENAIKTQKQNEQLKQSTQPQSTPPPKTNQSGYVGQLPKLGTNVTTTPPSTGGDIYSDKMPWAWLDKAVPNSYGMDY